MIRGLIGSPSSVGSTDTRIASGAATSSVSAGVVVSGTVVPASTRADGFRARIERRCVRTARRQHRGDRDGDHPPLHAANISGHARASG